MNSEAMLLVNETTKSFGGLVAVDRVSFSVRSGQIVGLIGPNGSGKTTMMNLVSGALAPDKGSISLGGVRLSGLPAHRIAKQGVGRTFQLVRLLADMTVEENVMAALVSNPRIPWNDGVFEICAQSLAFVGLGGRGATSASDLTYIDQKRLELARAIAFKPKLLLLDEWLAGLNASELKEGIALLRSVRERGMTILMVEHVMSAIHALCDWCVVMNRGSKIAEGLPSNVLNDPNVVEAYLGEPVHA